MNAPFARSKMRTLLAALTLAPAAAFAAQLNQPPMGLFVRWAQGPDGLDQGGREALLRAREEGAEPARDITSGAGFLR